MYETERLDALKDEYLEHYGVKGMKWGIIRSREELGYKDAPKKKKKAGFVQSLKQKRQAKLKAKAKAEAVKMEEAAKKAEEKAAKKAEEADALRQRALRGDHKDIDFIYKNRELLSNRELEDTLKRINTERALKKMIDDRPSDFEKAMKTLKKINGTMDDVYSMWDSKSMKAIRKTLFGEKDSDKDKDKGGKESKGKKEQSGDDSGNDGNYSVNVREVMRNLDRMNDAELQRVVQRLTRENTLRTQVSTINARRAAEVQADIDRVFYLAEQQRLRNQANS